MPTCDELSEIIECDRALFNLYLVLLIASDGKLNRYLEKGKRSCVVLFFFYGFTPSMILRMHERSTWIRSEDVKHLSLPPEVHRHILKDGSPIPSKRDQKALRMWGKAYRMAIRMREKEGQPRQLELSFVV